LFVHFQPVDHSEENRRDREKGTEDTNSSSSSLAADVPKLTASRRSSFAREEGDGSGLSVEEEDGDDSEAEDETEVEAEDSGNSTEGNEDTDVEDDEEEEEEEEEEDEGEREEEEEEEEEEESEAQGEEKGDEIYQELADSLHVAATEGDLIVLRDTLSRTKALAEDAMRESLAREASEGEEEEEEDRSAIEKAGREAVAELVNSVDENDWQAIHEAVRTLAYICSLCLCFGTTG
jgi:hypothetical protein